jgi:hypothetical protein
MTTCLCCQKPFGMIRKHEAAQHIRDHISMARCASSAPAAELGARPETPERSNPVPRARFDHIGVE